MSKIKDWYPEVLKLRGRVTELEATLRHYLKNADTRIVKGFNFDEGEYPVTSETIAILCKEKADLKEKLSLYLGGWPSLEQRIEELKAKVTSLQLIEKHLLQCCKDHKSRIEELEARIDKALKHLPERPGMAMGFLLEKDDE